MKTMSDSRCLTLLSCRCYITHDAGSPLLLSLRTCSCDTLLRGAASGMPFQMLNATTAKIKQYPKQQKQQLIQHVAQSHTFCQHVRGKLKAWQCNQSPAVVPVALGWSSYCVEQGTALQRVAYLNEQLTARLAIASGSSVHGNPTYCQLYSCRIMHQAHTPPSAHHTVAVHCCQTSPTSSASCRVISKLEPGRLCAASARAEGTPELKAKAVWQQHAASLQ